MLLPIAVAITTVAFSTSSEPGTSTALTELTQTIGLSGECLAASGVEPSQIPTVVAALRASVLVEQLSQLKVQIRATESALKAAQSSPNAESESGTQAIADSTTLLTQLRVQRATVVASARQLVREQVGAAQGTALGNWWAAPPFLPAEMRVRTWSAEEAKRVREALASHKRCAERSETVPSDVLMLLAAIRAETPVASAASNLPVRSNELSAALTTALATSN